MTDTEETRPFKVRASKGFTEELLATGTIKDRESNYLKGIGVWTSFEYASVYGPHVEPSSHLFEKVYLD